MQRKLSLPTTSRPVPNSLEDGVSFSPKESPLRLVQIAVSDAAYAAELQLAMLQGGAWDVVRTETPSTDLPGVAVVDDAHLDRLGFPLKNPERIVLLTRNEPSWLSRAWEAGIISVIFATDPPSIAILAITSAFLRGANPRPAMTQAWPQTVSLPAGSGAESAPPGSKRCKNRSSAADTGIGGASMLPV